MPAKAASQGQTIKSKHPLLLMPLSKHASLIQLYKEEDWQDNTKDYQEWQNLQSSENRILENESGLYFTL